MSGQTESQWKLKWALGQWEDKSSHISTTKVSFSIWVSAWQQSRCVVGIFVGGQSLIVQKKRRFVKLIRREKEMRKRTLEKIKSKEDQAASCCSLGDVGTREEGFQKWGVTACSTRTAWLSHIMYVSYVTQPRNKWRHGFWFTALEWYPFIPGLAGYHIL